MRISNYQVDLAASAASKEYLKIETKKLEPQQDQVTTGSLEDTLNHFLPKDKGFQISLFDHKEVSGVESLSQVYELSEEDYQKITMLEKILSALTGKEVKFILPKRVTLNGQANGKQKAVGQEGQELPRPEGGQAYYQRRVTYQHKQSMNFEAKGQVKTEDGRLIDFDFKAFSKSETNYFKEENLDIHGKVVDPLVITYNGNLPALTKEKYSFDLDFDGAADQISFLTKGSGFLALDINENGQIDDGRELFGPQSGSGFSDLALHDQDQNGWIDENDAIFNKLRIWELNDEGQQVLVGLGQVGVGAIYLGHVATDYALGGSPLSADGFIRQTGIFLKESGTAGMVSHIDLSL